MPFASVRQAVDLGAIGVGATIYFGSEESTRQIREVSELFAEAHRHGLFTVLWCYLRNPAFKTPEADYHLAADLTGQANHLGVTIEADIIKQKLPENNGGYTALKFGRTDPLVYSELTTDHPIDLTRWQVVNCYAGRIGLINSGGESSGAGDLRPGGPHGGHQQACRRHGPHRRAKGVPAPHERGRRHHQRGPGRLPRRLGDRRLIEGPFARSRRDRALSASPHVCKGGRRYNADNHGQAGEETDRGSGGMQAGEPSGGAVTTDPRRSTSRAGSRRSTRW